MTEIKNVTIVGCGLVGSSWATIFASAGLQVKLFDISEDQLSTALRKVEENLKKLDETGLQRGGLTAEQALCHVTTTSDMTSAFVDADYVQESTVEDVEFRKNLYRKFDDVIDVERDTIIASSTSTIPASRFTEELRCRRNCLVVHPVNPPLFLTLTEVVPAPWTSKSTVERTMMLMRRCGQKPVELKKEVKGFAVNRLQYVLLAEVWRLVADDVISVDDVDTVMSAGLGPRYAFQGTLETMHLNAPHGIRDYFRRYGGAIREVSASMGPLPEFSEPEVIDEMDEKLGAKMGVEEISRFQKEREERLIELAKLKKKFGL